MKIFPPPLEIGETEGFSPEKDIFKRSELGKGLTNLVSSVSDPMVVALDGQWGSGKTTFLKMWAGELRKNGFPVVYFDAFNNDFSENPFIAIAEQIISLAEERKKENTPVVKKFATSTLATGKNILRSGLKVGAKALTLGALDEEDFGSIASDIASETSNLVDTHVQKILCSQKEKKKTVEDFKSTLTELPTLLAIEASNDIDEVSDSTSKNLIFIIDELDRCRPSFAIELLEHVKHLFSVPNVHFILGTNIKQLQNSVTSTYGSMIDASTYLEKFIHITFFLVDEAKYNNERTIYRYLEYLKKVMEFSPEDLEVVDFAFKFIGSIAEHKNLSLRTIERITTVLSVSLAFTTKDHLRIGPILSGLCVLKSLYPELYEKAKRGKLSFEEVSKALLLEEPLSDTEYRVDWVIDWWEYCTKKDISPRLEKRLSGFSPFRYNISDRLDIVPIIANKIIDRLKLS